MALDYRMQAGSVRVVAGRRRLQLSVRFAASHSVASRACASQHQLSWIADVGEQSSHLGEAAAVTLQRSRKRPSASMACELHRTQLPHHRTLSPRLGFEGSYRRRFTCHDEDLSRGVQKFGRELLVGGHRRAVAALALDGELLQALREAALDRELPARVRSYASTSRRRRVDGVEATSGDVDTAARESICDHGRGRPAIPRCRFRPSRPRRAPPAPS